MKKQQNEKKEVNSQDAADRHHNGHRFYFERRRYGKTTYTWIYIEINGKWRLSGDPLPKVQPSGADLDEAAKCARRGIEN